MRKIFLLILSTLTFTCLYSQSISRNDIEVAANSTISYHNKIDFSINDIVEIQNKDSMILLYHVKLKPTGYIIFQTEYELEPMIAYSYTDTLNNGFKFFLKEDAQNRYNKLAEYQELKDNKNIEKWNNLLNKNVKINCRDFQQWPEEGTTNTGGWLTTKWHQNSPYNTMCPYDNVANSPSVAGCPAIAAGMILDYHKTLNNTRFDETDKYQHNYAGNNFMIDDDYEEYKFPSFDSLNQILSDIEEKFENNVELENNEKAAIVFACGTAATQVYNSGGSGTFGVSQANDLYERFGFETAELYTELNDVVREKLISNMKEAYPAHLAVVDANWQYGHNVVVDGYNTDDYFHINFGWGGSSNGWWNIPDDNFPYTMNTLEGIILDINYKEPVVEIENFNSEIFVFPNPGNGKIHLQINYTLELNKIEVYNLEGRKILVTEDYNNYIDISNENPGIYMIKLFYDNQIKTQKYILL